VCEHSHAFERTVINKRILVTRCVYCNTRYGTPREDVLLLVECIHRCSVVESVSARSSGD
jgi:hypothetical protein